MWTIHTEGRSGLPKSAPMTLLLINLMPFLSNPPLPMSTPFHTSQGQPLVATTCITCMDTIKISVDEV